jgi:diguanylate cyclase (GGDEF)-like protein
MADIPSLQNFSQNLTAIEFPGGPVPLNSKFYIERSSIEARAYTELSKPGSLLRIRAPRKMGKSSLMLRLIHYAISLGYRTVTIDFQQADAAVFESLDKFLRWICINITRKLKLDPVLDEYWDEEMGSKVSCSIYFEGYLLEIIKTPLILVLNEVNYIFEHPQIAREFFPLLRFWHEQARQTETWQKLRLVVVHSTEIYVSLNLNQSPFNVGFSLKLAEFTSEQVKDLASRYNLHLSDEQLQKLMTMVGGHPYLVHLAFYNLFHYHAVLEDLIEYAATQTGIYQDHLQSLGAILQKKPELLAAFKQVNETPEPVQLEIFAAHQLESLGLVKLNGNFCHVSCQLYHLYFYQQGTIQKHPNVLRLQQLEQENQQLQSLVYIDPLTQVANRRQFDNCLQMEWKRMTRDLMPLSLIICDIDHFKKYNDQYGHQAGDECLQKVAQAIREVLKRPGDLVARYGGEEFVVILPQTDAAGALKVAEEMRLNVKRLTLLNRADQLTNNSQSCVTISLGIASTIPNSTNDTGTLFLAADEALYQSKKNGRDCISLSSFLKFQY